MRLMHICAAALLATASVATAAAASLGTHDTTYLQTAIQVQAGRYAMAYYEAQHGSGAAQKYASEIASQAAHDSRMLEQMAKHYGVTPPSGLLIEDRYHYGQLQGLQGSELDKTFARELRISDQINQDSDRQEMRHGANATLKSYAKHRYSAIQHEVKTLKHF